MRFTWKMLDTGKGKEEMQLIIIWTKNKEIIINKNWELEPKKERKRILWN